MIVDMQVLRRGDAILLGIAVEHAVLDIETSETLLRECLALLDTPHKGLIDGRIGQFGNLPVTLSIDADETVAIFVDGPYFEPSRNQSAGLYLSKDDARRAIEEALAHQNG